MSKYRVVIGHSRIRQVFVALFILLCNVPVWLLSSDTYSVVWFFQCVLSAGLIILAWQRSLESQPEHVISIEDTGTWTKLNDHHDSVWRISRGSRVSSLLLWVELTPLGPSGSNKRQWLWVFPDSVNQLDYRRLCRIIIRSQSDIKEVSDFG